MIKFIEEIKRHHCFIAIDDFGSGYSNFNYLTVLPIDILKIDGSLIKDIVKNENFLRL
ncbi:MAG: EAL domain-containing protein [Psychrobium sp.]|nr:EAL domain-containing protein [Psychrobium sp.]